MKVVTIIRVDFTDEERKAIKTLADINCGGIKCEECPFNVDGEYSCLIGYIKRIATERGII